MHPLSPQRLERLAHDLAARSDDEVTHALRLYEVTDRVAVRHAIDAQREARGIQAKAQEPPRRAGEQDGSFYLRQLGIHGPLSLQTLEAKMTAAGLEPGVRIEVKQTATDRGWLPRLLGYRLEAQGLATDQTRSDRLATDDARYTPPTAPLGLQMATLYQRVGLQEDVSYSHAEVDERLRAADLPVEHRMALKHALATRGQLRAGADLQTHTAKMHALLARLKAARV